jgi:glutathionyl-hydroquinone reductase
MLPHSDLNPRQRGYFLSMRDINPYGIVPLGPLPDVEPLDAKAKDGWNEENWKGFAE